MARVVLHNVMLQGKKYTQTAVQSLKLAESLHVLQKQPPRVGSRQVYRQRQQVEGRNSMYRGMGQALKVTPFGMSHAEICLQCLNLEGCHIAREEIPPLQC
jgi:hypothetical protein